MSRRCGWGPWVVVGEPKPTSEDPEGLLHFTTEEAEAAEESQTHLAKRAKTSANTPSKSPRM